MMTSQCLNRWKRSALLVLAFACMAMTGLVNSLQAQDADISTEIHLKFLTRILSYDRNLPARVSGGTIVVGVLYQEKVWTSLTQKKEIEALAKSGLEVNGIKVEFRMFPITEGVTADKLPGRDQVSIYFITPMRSVNISTLVQKCNAEKILTYSSVPYHTTKGVAISVEQKGESPGIVINHTASVTQGCDFSAQLLKVARIVK